MVEIKSLLSVHRTLYSRTKAPSRVYSQCPIEPSIADKGSFEGLLTVSHRTLYSRSKTPSRVTMSHRTLYSRSKAPSRVYSQCHTEPFIAGQRLLCSDHLKMQAPLTRGRVFEMAQKLQRTRIFPEKCLDHIDGLKRFERMKHDSPAIILQEKCLDDIDGLTRLERIKVISQQLLVIDLLCFFSWNGCLETMVS